MKRCGKSAPPGQQWTGHGKPHTEQDQIGADTEPTLSLCDKGGAPHSEFSDKVGSVARWLGTPQRPGRSLELRSDVQPRGMIVTLAKAGVQNSAYRSGCQYLFKEVRRKACLSSCGELLRFLVIQRRLGFRGPVLLVPVGGLALRFRDLLIGEFSPKLRQGFLHVRAHVSGHFFRNE